MRKIIDAVRIQFSVSIRQKRGTKIAPEAIEMLIKRWMDGATLPQGVRIDAVVWQNPERTRQNDRDLRGAGTRDAIARLLQGKPFRHVHETAEEARSSLAAIAATQPIKIKFR